jgi:hypothetical protein
MFCRFITAETRPPNHNPLALPVLHDLPAFGPHPKHADHRRRNRIAKHTIARVQAPWLELRLGQARACRGHLVMAPGAVPEGGFKLCRRLRPKIA